MHKSIVIRCILFGFIAAFVLGLVYPTFLNPKEKMIFFHYILQMKKIGMDLRAMMFFATSWAIDGGSPYRQYRVINPYPPLASVFFSPLAYLPFRAAYAVVTGMTLTSYVLSCTILVRKICRHVGDMSIVYIFMISGLFSYGLHFEIERGQFNLIAITFAMAALALWQKEAPLSRRILAYVLLSIGIQLKLYPAIFALCLTDNLRDWKRNLIRLAGLGAVNVLALFVLGIDVFKNFYHNLSLAMSPPKYSLWVGAHSIKAFANVSNFDAEPFWVVLLLCLAVVVLLAFLRKRPGNNPFLLVVLSSVTLLAPALSHDYKLAVLHPFVCILMVGVYKESNPIRYLRIAEYVILSLVSWSYFLTFYSVRHKKIWGMGEKYFQNNMPLIFVVLIGATLLMLSREWGAYWGERSVRSDGG